MAKGLPRSLANSDQLNVREEVIDVTGTVVPVTAAAGTGDQNKGLGTVVVGQLAAADLLFLGAKCEVAFAGPGDNDNLADVWEGDFAVGTAPDADGTLNGSEVDLVASTAIGPATAEVISSVRATNVTAALIDNRSGDLELNFNLTVDAAAASGLADGTSADITLTGTVTVVYVPLGEID